MVRFEDPVGVFGVGDEVVIPFDLQVAGRLLAERRSRRKSVVARGKVDGEIDLGKLRGLSFGVDDMARLNIRL